MTSGRSCRVELSVPFHDLDPMQVVWHGNYMKYFEHARQRLFDDSGVDLYGMAVSDGYLFPVIRTATKHISPLRFRDRVEVRARVVEAQRRIVLEFELRLLPEGKLCATGRSEQVAVRMRGDRPMAPDATTELELSIPESVRRALLAEGESS